MSISSFQNKVPLIDYGGSVSSQGINNALKELTNRTDYLLGELNDAQAGKSLICDAVSTSAAVTPISAVAWDPVQKRFDLATATVLMQGGQVTADPQAIFAGICIAKTSAVIGDVAIAGAIELTLAQVTNLLNNVPPTSGLVYLSTTTAGKLTQTRPALGIVAGYLITPTDGCNTEYRLLIHTGLNSNWLGQDRVIEYPLTALPAGTHVPPAFGGTHSIGPVDLNKPGWLPASNPVFGGTAPVGAFFGYHIDKDPALLAMWPPAGKRMKLEFLSKADIGTSGFKRVPQEYYTINNRTIWWMTNCYSQVPWDFELNTNFNFSTPACELQSPTQLLATFDRSPLDASNRVVTKLKSSTDGLITFVNEANVISQVGDLTAKFNANATIQATDVAGDAVLKSITSGFKFNSGFVVEGIRTTDAAISVTGTRNRLIDPSIAESPTNFRYHQGIVTISAANDAAGEDLSPALVRLGDSAQRFFNGVSYIGFPTGLASSMTCRYDVANGLVGTYTLQPYVVLFGRGPGAYAAMTASYFIIASPPTPGSPQILNPTPVALPFNIVTPSTGLPANSVIKVATNTIQLFPGDTAFVTFSRANTSTYPFDVGFIRIGAMLKPL